MGFLGPIVMEGLSLLATLFVFVVGIFALFVIVLFIADVSQTKDAIRRNYPVIGHFRYLFIRLGEFSGSISLPSTGRSFRSTARNATGSPVPRRGPTTRSRSAPRAA